MLRGCGATLLCSYILWSMFVVDRQDKFVRVMGPISQKACVAEIRARVPYEDKAGVMRYYAPDPKKGDRLVCFPSDYAPRDG